MVALEDDNWLNDQTVNHAVSEIEDCAIAVDATYYLQLFLDNSPYHEPLLSALGGLTGIQTHIEADLDQWKAHRIIPLFVFDGQVVAGQDEITVMRGRRANEKTDQAWELYFNGRAEEAVSAFGSNSSSFQPQALYPMLQDILKRRELHFLTPPYNASAQLAYFDMIDSEQVGGIMGAQELFLYPIKDSIIRSIDWDTKVVTAISKKHLLKALNVSELLFVDAFLLSGTSFLSPFPPLQDPSIIKAQPFSIADAVNILRTSEKSVAVACTSFNDILKAHDPNWLDKYRKARMVVDHFIYIAESGEVKVNDYERLTSDNHEYLGLQLPSELYHYLNTGLIGPRVLSWITHGQHHILPTLDGVASDEYKKLITRQLTGTKEASLGLMIPRLNRGIGFKKISMKLWYDRSYTYSLWDREAKAGSAPKAGNWTIDASLLTKQNSGFSAGSISSELLALQNPKTAESTLTDGKGKPPRLETADQIITVCLWRFFHIRGYVDDKHVLTPWGAALVAAIAALEPTIKKYPGIPNLVETMVIAFELLRFDILNARNRHEELRGLPMNGSDGDQDSLLLISRIASLLKLRHEANGYTGPLSKNLLAFRSLASETRAANRDLIESLLASMYMHAQVRRDKHDNWAVSHKLPFLYDPDVALGIAVKTFLDDVSPSDSAELKAQKKEQFPGTYLPYATNFSEDLEIFYAFFDALSVGIKAVAKDDLSAADRAVWESAAKFIEVRK
ncbi:nuclease-like protein [Thozetella sp. PMI_491]|nr:nuclease-like protein [Thozetella sp. PMI_491]